VPGEGCSSFHYSYRAEAGHQASQARCLTDPGHLVHVLIRIVGLLREETDRSGAHRDPPGFQFVLDLAAMADLEGGVAAHHPARTVSGGIEGGVVRNTSQHPGRGSHRTWEKDRLTYRLQIFGQVGMTGSKSTGSPLAVDTEKTILPIDLVSFEFGQVVGDVVDQIHPGLFG
jgi:hypothetical protein